MRSPPIARARHLSVPALRLEAGQRSLQFCADAASFTQRHYESPCKLFHCRTAAALCAVLLGLLELLKERRSRPSCADGHHDACALMPESAGGLHLGIDGGGTTTTCVVLDGQHEIGRSTSNCSNWNSVGAVQALEAIRSSVDGKLAVSQLTVAYEPHWHEACSLQEPSRPADVAGTRRTPCALCMSGVDSAADAERPDRARAAVPGHSAVCQPARHETTQWARWRAALAAVCMAQC